nr:hypothetical protein [Burkholderia ambifaria]
MNDRNTGSDAAPRRTAVIINQITPLDTRRSRVYTYIAYRLALPAAVLRALSCKRAIARPLIREFGAPDTTRPPWLCTSPSMMYRF